MGIEVKVPAVGESITEVTIASWLKQDGEAVELDEPICELESDKATVELPAPEAGVLSISVEEGETIEIGAVIAQIAAGEGKVSAKPAASAANTSSEASAATQNTTVSQGITTTGGDSGHIASPAAKKLMNEHQLAEGQVIGTGKDGRITKDDVQKAIALKPLSNQKPLELVEQASVTPASSPQVGGVGPREITRKKMTGLRKTIAKRLVAAKNTTAMLTTFNEVDMKAVMDLRKKYKEVFKEKHEVGLGFMSFFTKAVCLALKQVPGVNAQIDGQEIVYHDYCDIGVAVSTPKGLVVPVVRNAEQMGLAGIEKNILDLALRARDNKISIDEMQGGTFTITNGGVFGSMLSTPIINAPQSAILGMHNIVQRPVVVNGEIVIRPVMFLALSYDHRIVDGKESVTFLKTVKEYIEDPARLLLEV
jgi:2-oxoglutarate dehydrogenase E2 component (dihydrolipoamide succinyltransferase)